jgi:hypothetical protein
MKRIAVILGVMAGTLLSVAAGPAHAVQSKATAHISGGGNTPPRLRWEKLQRLSLSLTLDEEQRLQASGATDTNGHWLPCGIGKAPDDWIGVCSIRITYTRHGCDPEATARFMAVNGVGAAQAEELLGCRGGNHAYVLTESVLAWNDTQGQIHFVLAYRKVLLVR